MKATTRCPWVRLLLVLGFVVVWGVLGALQAQAHPSAEPSAPKISITPAELSIHVTGNVTTILPMIVNNGSAAVNVTANVNFDHHRDGCTAPEVELDGDAATFAPKETRAQPIALSIPDECAGQKGTLTLMVDGAQAASARFSVTRDFTENRLWIPVWVALAGFVLAAVIGLAAASASLSEPVHVASSWSFKDSWVTNVAALGAVLTAVLAATGLLDAIIPGTTTGRLIGLSLLFGALVLAAPIVYSASSTWGWETLADGSRALTVQGRCWGVAVAAAATIAGVVGQLATIGLITHAADGTTAATVFIYCCLGAAAMLLLGYEWVFVHGVTKQPPSGTTTTSMPVRQDVSATL
ncbi:hypothetical protein G7043_32735 [Lentzea sp. NEAU-D13]|uniref:Uncharacterized protein n=1 Tax=Lentzea alba TaxID=2714351 RepID=A0A7C9VXZ3_9PSEU|nr:hypothetical protein [Lentzea alba]NGY63696.1 hypothetical protein [Lentzea alba]